MRTRLLILVSLLALCAPVAARAGAVTQDPCAPVSYSVLDGEISDAGHVFENVLLTQQGELWVSDDSSGAIRRFALPSLSELAPPISLPSPGAMVQAANGTVFANFGDSAAGALQHTHQAGIVKIDPATLNVTPFVSGLDMANGLAMDAEGTLYVSNDVGEGLYAVSPDGVARLLNGTYGTNGLVVLPGAPETLYSNITFDSRSPIEGFDLGRLPNGSIDGTEIWHDYLSAGAPTLQPALYTDDVDPSKPLVGLKGLDDITTDGTYLYPVANGMGELLRVDPATGDACLIDGSLQNPSSVRIVPAGSALDPGYGTTFVISGFDGTVRVETWTPIPYPY